MGFLSVDEYHDGRFCISMTTMVPEVRRWADDDTAYSSCFSRLLSSGTSTGNTDDHNCVRVISGMAVEILRFKFMHDFSHRHHSATRRCLSPCRNSPSGLQIECRNLTPPLLHDARRTDVFNTRKQDQLSIDG